MLVSVLKVLNSRVAEEMDIVENHLTGLTGIYCIKSFSRNLYSITYLWSVNILEWHSKSIHARDL